jgi:hypothetical protein
MSATETYTVLLRSSDGVGTNNISRKFFVDWASILPTGVDKFQVKGWFRSVEDAGNDQDYVFIGVDTLQTTIWDSGLSGRSTIVCTGCQFNGNTNYVYQSLANDVDKITVTRPTQTYVTVSIRQYSGALVTTAPGNWFLWLQFTPLS